MAWFGVYEYLCKLLTPDGCTKDDLPGYLTAVSASKSRNLPTHPPVVLLPASNLWLYGGDPAAPPHPHGATTACCLHVKGGSSLTQPD